jgi:hypothetical protein
MTKEQKQLELDKAMQVFFDKGNNIQKLPAQESKIKYVCKAKTCYSVGRMRWQHMYNRTLPQKVA